MKKTNYLLLAAMTFLSAIGITACNEESTPPAEPIVTEVNPTSVKVGRQILINGRNFSATTGENKVSINGIGCTVNFATTYQMIVTVPTMESGTYPIAVTVNGMTAAGPEIEVIKPVEVIVKEEIITVTRDAIYIPDVTGGAGVHAIENIGDGHLLLASSDDSQPNVIYDYDYATKTATELHSDTKTWYWTMTSIGNNKVLLPSKANSRLDVLDLETKEVTRSVASSLPQILRACADADGNLYVLLRDEAKIYKYKGISGEGKEVVLDAKDSDGLLRDMCFDNDGNLLVLGHSVIYCIAPGSSEPQIIAGYPKQEGTDADLHDFIGNPEECRFVKGRSIFCDSKGYVWFSDEWNITRVFSPGENGYEDGSIKIVNCPEMTGGKLGEIGQFCNAPTGAEHEVWAVSWNYKTVFTITVEYE